MLSSTLPIITQWLRFAIRLVAAIPAAGPAQIPRRTLLFLLVWLAQGLLNASHLLGFLLDACLFPGYRKTAIKQPVFILGVPRSGTTWLQRVISQDSQFTTLTLWECVLAPSISERYFWRGAFALFRPLGRLIPFNTLLFKPGKRMDAIHTIRLDEPEEDFLLLAPLHACFLFVLLCPDEPDYWALTRFDQLDERRRRQVMHYYRRCLQKHLYFHGTSHQPPQTLLSKNPSFTPFIDTLRDTFPDARFIACVRDPLQAVPSQLSAVLPALQGLGYRTMDPQLQNRMLDMLHHYYETIQANSHQPFFVTVEMKQLQQQLQPTLKQIYRQLELDYTPQLDRQLLEAQQQGQRYRSAHGYNLDQFDLTDESVHTQFADVWPLPFAASPKLSDIA